MATPSNPLSAGVPALQPPKPMQTMIGPDGSVRDVPVEMVPQVVAAGGKMGIDMIGPDGTSATVPIDIAHEVVKKGGRPVGVQAGAGMQESTAPKLIREATSTLPVIGAGLGSGAGAALASPGVVTTPLGSAAGAGLGAAAGNEAKQAIEQRIFGGAPLAPEARAVSDAKNAAVGAAFDLGGSAASGLLTRQNPYTAVKAVQGVKDSIREFLGQKADKDVVETLAPRVNPNWYSDVPNELKLAKNTLDADMQTWNANLDQVLAKSQATATNARVNANQVFDELTKEINDGVGTGKQSAIDAIDDVRKEVTSKLANAPTKADALNDVKRLIGDEVKKFNPPENLTSNEKVAQEAYRRAYFKLRDMVSTLEPESATLNKQISDGFKAQDLLERKFPHLTTPADAQASYDAAAEAAKKAKILKGAAIVAPAAAGTVYGIKKLTEP